MFLVVLTPAAVASSWVRNETNDAIDLEVRGEVRFIPLDVAACTVPTLWNIYQRVPFRGRYEDGLAALLSRLGMRAGAGETGDGETRRQGDRAETAERPLRIEVAARRCASPARRCRS